MADLSETTVRASNKVFNSLCVPDKYYITQAIIKLQFIRCIQVDTIYKSRKSDHIPVSLRMSEEEPFKRFNKKLQHNVRMILYHVTCTRICGLILNVPCSIMQGTFISFPFLMDYKQFIK